MIQLRKSLILTALCMALCTVLPFAFHAIPNGGQIFSPIHIPVLLCGLVCGRFWGLACGIGGTLLASVLTGMPPMAYLPPMLLECAVYGYVTGMSMRFVRTGRNTADLYIALVLAMVLGRILAGAAKAWIFAPGTMTVGIFVTSYFVTSLPGIILHLILIPTVVLALQRAHLVDLST